MDIKSNLQYLSEAAAIDMKNDTKTSIRLETVSEAYKAIPEAPEAMVTEASDVIVTAVSEDKYYVEMVNLAPFMLDSNITSIAKALDMVAEANGFPAKSVGLVVESQSKVDKMLSSAREKSIQTHNARILENAVAKVNKNNAIIKKLLSEGYRVAKKSDKAEVCPDCGKAKCKCECGDNNTNVSETYVYTAELDNVLESVCESGNFEAIQEFFKFKDHEFKNAKEIKNYIKHLETSSNAAQEIAEFAIAYITIHPILSAHFNYSMSRAATFGGVIISGAGSVALMSIIVTALFKAYLNFSIPLQRKVYTRIKNKLENKIGKIEDAIKKCNDNDKIKEDRKTISEFKKGIDMINKKLDELDNTKS